MAQPALSIDLGIVDSKMFVRNEHNERGHNLVDTINAAGLEHSLGILANHFQEILSTLDH